MAIKGEGKGEGFKISSLQSFLNHLASRGIADAGSEEIITESPWQKIGRSEAISYLSICIPDAKQRKPANYRHMSK